MNLAKKAVLFCQREGLIRTVGRTVQKASEIVKRIPFQAKEKRLRKHYISELAKEATGKTVFILIPCIDWKIPLFQRPHQIAAELAKRPNSLVLFVSDQYRYDCFAGFEKVNNHLFLFSHRMIDVLNDVLEEAKEKIVMMCWMRQSHLLECFHYDKLVYEYIDDMSLFYYHTPAMEKEHYRLMREADLTVCTADELYQKALPHAKKAILSPNAGDYTFFHNNRNCACNESLRGKIENKNCVIGYYGCLASWFDYDLVMEVAARQPTWCFVLVGYCFDGTVDRLKKVNRDNIVLIPAQPYQSLPSFVAAFDIQCIPFVVNDITRSTSPVKLFEYMASGKPIITSELPECKKYRSVWTYCDADDFICKAEELLALKWNNDYFTVMDEEAQQNTWKARINTILQNI